MLASELYDVFVAFLCILFAVVIAGILGFVYGAGITFYKARKEFKEYEKLKR